MNKHIFILFVFSLFLTFQSGTVKANDGYQFGEIEGGAALKSICKKVQSATFPEKDLPTPFEITLLNESSPPCYDVGSYYGDDYRKVDYKKARLCALMGLGSSHSLVIGGDVILMMLYANGQGVKRNLDIATKLACNRGSDSPAEKKERITHLQKMKRSKNPAIFDYCDDVTNTETIAHCEGIKYQITQSQRKIAFEKIKKKLPQKQKAAFQQLLETASSYFLAQKDYETDDSGTGRNIFPTMELNDREQAFFIALKKVEAGHFPSCTTTSFKKIDNKLNAIYQNVRAKEKNSERLLSTDVQTGQKAWLAYRNAWVTFGAIRYPHVASDCWKDWLTRERIQQLQEFQDLFING